MLSRQPMTSEMVQVLIADQLVGVVGPDVGAVGQAGDLDQVGKALGLGVQQHAADKVGAHLGDAEGAGLAADLLRRDAQRLRAR